MKFSNPKVPEGINVSRHKPVADLLLLSAGLTLSFILAAIALFFIGGALAHYMPVSWEIAMADTVMAGFEESESESRERAELQALAARLSRYMDLPDGMEVTVHYVEDDAVNALASFGGHIYIVRGLIEVIPNENALAMVMAHEISHVANRDAIGNIGGALLLQVGLSIAFGSSPDSAYSVLRIPQLLLQLEYSRQVESRADADALKAVAALYGHVAGAPALFETLLKIQDQARAGDPPEFLSSHPLSRSRIDAIEARARANGWPLDGIVTPLPAALAALKANTTR